MEIYVLQVLTGNEEKLLKEAEAAPFTLDGVLSFPRRQLSHRKRGVESLREVPLYGGYLFYQCDELSREDIQNIRTLNSFVRFLPATDRARPLPRHEKEVLFRLLSGGDLIRISRVRFDENDRIIVVDGPLKGYEGTIVRVDKRKRRARIRLDLYDKSYPVDFGFEVLQGND